MKALMQFLSFNFAQFIQGKAFMVTGSKPWTEYETGKPLGTVVTVVIIQDNTPYAKTKDGHTVSNLYEKMNWKVARDVNIPVGTRVVPVGGVATVYGEYRNNLSVKVDDIQQVQGTAAPAPVHTPTGKGLGHVPQ